MTERATPETDDHFRNRSSYIKEDYELCERLERQRDELVEVLELMEPMFDTMASGGMAFPVKKARALLSRIRHSEG